MYIESIDMDKIKVTIDTNEQVEYGVTYESMSYGDRNTRRLCEKIMSMAKSQMGFALGKSKLLVEARPSTNGNITLYLSKIAVEITNTANKKNAVFKFDNATAMLEGCECFNRHLDDIIKSDLYYYDNNYYIDVEILLTDSEYDSLYYSIIEYGEKSTISNLTLSEYGERISEGNAIHKVLFSVSS